jgi:anti-sigma factor RsiW
METAELLRDELHSYIDALPERSLPAEENIMIEESLAEHRADPSSVTLWRKVRKG